MFRIFVSFLYIYFIILHAIYFVRIKCFLKQPTYMLYICRMTRSKDSFLPILLFIFSLESSSLPVVSTLSQSRRSRNYNPSCPFYWSAQPPQRFQSLQFLMFLFHSFFRLSCLCPPRCCVAIYVTNLSTDL